MENILLENLYILKKQDLIESAFRDILNGVNIDASLKKIEKFLLTEFNVKSTVTMYDSINKNYFFGMRIWPSKEESERIALEIVKNKTDLKFIRCENVDIEIDSKLIDSKGMKFNEKELTAILIHEIGHKVFSNKAIEEYGNLYRRQVIGGVGTVIAWASGPMAVLNVFVVFAIIGLFIAISAIDESLTARKVEEMADSLAVKYGYGMHLESALEKIQKHFYGLPKKGNNKDFLSQFTIWVSNNTTDIGIRRKYILEVLKKEQESCDSEVEKKMLETQIRRISMKL